MSLSSARWRIVENSGFVRSSILRFRVLMYAVFSFRKGYFARSVFVNFVVAVGFFMLFCFDPWGEVECEFSFFGLLEVEFDGHV